MGGKLRQPFLAERTDGETRTTRRLQYPDIETAVPEPFFLGPERDRLGAGGRRKLSYRNEPPRRDGELHARKRPSAAERPRAKSRLDTLQRTETRRIVMPTDRTDDRSKGAEPDFTRRGQKRLAIDLDMTDRGQNGMIRE